MKNQDLSHIDVANYLPHRAPLLMVSSVLEIDETSVTTEFHISEGCIFIKNGFFVESGLMENIAQTATGVVGQSFFDKNDLDGTGKKLVGYISAIKKIAISKLPRIQDTIITKAKLLSRFDTGTVTMCSFEAETYLHDQIIVKATMQFLIHEV